MKKITIILIAAFITLAICGTIYAKYLKGYVVVNKTEDTVIIKDKNDTEISVKTTKPKKFKIGDEVNYDPDRKKLRPVREKYQGC